MEYAKFVKDDVNRKRAIYMLINMKLKGFVSEHSVDGLYWFNTEERMSENLRDLLVGANDVKVLL